MMSAKVYDGKGRFRDKIVSFRCSEEENALLNAAVKLSGLTKQDYITRRLHFQDVVVRGNPRVYKALRDQLVSVLGELHRIDAGNSVNEDLLVTIDMIAKILHGLKGESDAY